MAERITITEREPDPGQQWKCGDEFLPFHPQASHVPPEYRDGWNRCYWMAVGRAMPAAEELPSLSAINELARAYASSYASPHHITFTVAGLRHLLADLGAQGRR